MEKQRPKISKYNLITGTDSYASQTSQNPETARLLTGFIPGDDGGLYREWNDPQLGTGLPSSALFPIKKLFEFDWVGPTSNLVRYFFAVVLNSAGNNYQLWSLNLGTLIWSQVTAVGALANVPSVAKVQSANLLHLSDGAVNWLFDGTSWIKDGLQIPLIQPSINVIGSWQPQTNWGTGVMKSDSNGNIQIVSTNGQTGSSPPVWNTTQGGTTADGTVVWTCYGFPAGWLPSTVYAAHSVVYNSNGDFQASAGGGTSGASEPTWDGRIGQTTTDNSIAWTNKGKFVDLAPAISGTEYSDHEWSAANGYVVNQIVIDKNLNVQVCITSGTTGNTMPSWNATVGGTTNDNTVVWKNFGLVAALVSWQAGLTYSLHQPIVDSNGNFQIVTTAGTSGSTQPVWNSSFSTTNDGTVVWTMTGQAAAGLPPSAFIGKYYWYTVADDTFGRVHESTSSPISLSTGPLNHQVVQVAQTKATFAFNTGSPTVTISPAVAVYPGPLVPNFGSWAVGLALFVPGIGLVGIIKSVAANGLSLTLVANAAFTFNSGGVAIADPRTTHLHWYESESDGSKIGQQILQRTYVNFAGSAVVINGVSDGSPFIGSVGTSVISIFRPVRNDPPPSSLIAEVHKYRIWRRRESRPNFFNFTANEEVSSGLNGDPTQSVPGADVNTLSDIVNEQVYPDASNFIRAMCSHGDALYIGTEKQTLPLYGQSIDDFGLSQVTAFSLGVAGRDAMISTAHGLAMVSYDKKVFVYPTSNYYWAYVPNDVNVTDNLVEIGKPLRKVLEQLDTARIDETKLKFYFFGRRNWLVLSFPQSGGGYQTWVYDFSNKGWFKLANTYSSIDVWEVSTGNKILVGGSPNGNVYVLDDLTGTFVSSGNQPQSIWRPALIDFGDPDSKHIPLYVEVEFSNSLMANDISVNYYLDPVNVDNPGTPRTVILQQVSGANLFRGFFAGGNLCQRLLMEFNLAASPVSTNAGYIRVVKLVANPASGLIK